MEELAQSSPDQLEDLLGRVQSYNPQADLALIRRAYDYSARMHVDQKRESGEPYVIHPLNVALKLDVAIFRVPFQRFERGEVSRTINRQLFFLWLDKESAFD